MLTMLSTALMPVSRGSRTGWRAMTPGAMRSTGPKSLVAMGPLPSMGWPSAFTTRPTMSSPTGTDMMRRVRLTSSPSLISREVAHEHRAHGVFFEVEGDAHDAVRQLQQLAGHAALEAVDARDAVAQGEDGAHLGDVHAGGEPAELLADDLGDLFGPNVH